MLTSTSDDQQARHCGPIDGRVLRQALGLFVTGVTIITSGFGDEAAGTTVNSFTSVSLDPPRVLFCLHNQSRLRPVIEQTGAYAVNFLAGQQERLATAFAGRETASLIGVKHQNSETGVPVLSEALAFFSCNLVDAFDGGDHVIMVGQVIEFGTLRRHREPLIFFRGALGALEAEPHGAHSIFDG